MIVRQIAKTTPLLFIAASPAVDILVQTPTHPEVFELLTVLIALTSLVFIVLLSLFGKRTNS